LQQAIEDDEEDDDNLGFVELDNGLVIFKKLVERLFPHQVIKCILLMSNRDVMY